MPLLAHLESYWHACAQFLPRHGPRQIGPPVCEQRHPAQRVNLCSLRPIEGIPPMWLRMAASLTNACYGALDLDRDSGFPCWPLKPSSKLYSVSTSWSILFHFSWLEMSLGCPYTNNASSIEYLQKVRKGNLVQGFSQAHLFHPFISCKHKLI